MKKYILIQIISGLLIVLFAYAAISKIINHQVFYIELLKFPWLSGIAGFLSWFIPSVELITVALLFFPKTVLYGLYASALLLMLFTAFLILMMAFNSNLPCSCGGVIAQLSWKQHIAFNCFFMMISIAGIRLLKKHKYSTGNLQSVTGSM
ncbi:MAG: MauE/DoxX family redox-associated membrane protein [Bacteroidota bacterium]